MSNQITDAINHFCSQVSGTFDLFDFKKGLYLSDMYEDAACFNTDESVSVHNFSVSVIKETRKNRLKRVLISLFGVHSINIKQEYQYNRRTFSW